MEIEQVIKQIEWLDTERRNDRLIIEKLENRLSLYENALPGFNTQLKETGTEVVRISTMLSRFDQLDTSIQQMRIEFTRSLEMMEKQRNEAARESEKLRYADLEMLNKSIADVRKGLEPIAELKRNIQTRVEEDYRLGRLIEEAEQKTLNIRRSDEEYRRAQKLLEEGQRQDNKRLTDLLGEVASLRKRHDEQRSRVDLFADSIRKLEMRIGELQSSDSERRQNQVAFFEKQNMIMVDRERVWKEWQNRFEVIEKLAQGMDAQWQALDSTQRAVRRAQEAFEDITQRFERRINELTEMQRLTEDRFRQEWVAFKADDQKRWTNYALIQEEHQHELARQFDKTNERLTLLDDTAQELRDTVQQILEETQKRLQNLLAQSRNWMEEFNKTFEQKV